MRANIFIQIFDVLEVLLRLPIYFICAPLRVFSEFFEHPSLVSQAFGLTKYGYGAPMIRARMAHSIGHYANQAVILESVLSSLEDDLDLPLKRGDRVALFCIYRDLIHAYFLDGHLEDASEVAVRACRYLGREILPGFGDLTFKNAQLIKASLAAGRMVDPDTDTTFVVRARHKKNRMLDAGKNRRRIVKTDSESTENSDDSNTGKVIPFRLRPDNT